MNKITSQGPLHGIRVIDMTSVVVGPVCTRTLADQGADVLKIEPPDGDLLRNLAMGSRNAGMSGKFINFNRNKRSVCINIKHPDGLQALNHMISHADVFVSNIRPNALARAGLDYASLKAKNPRLVYCGIVAFGHRGSYYNRPAYDPIIQSLSGVANTFERIDGTPRFVPMVMTDHITGHIAAQNIGFALFRREKTGIGEEIETPMFENMAAFVLSEHLAAQTFIPPVGPTGDNRLLSEEYRPLPTLDGYITVGPNTDQQAFAFFAAIGQPELKEDPRYATAAARTAHADAYFKVRKAGLARRTTAEWLDVFEQIDVPAAAYNTIEDLLTDPHLVEAGFIEEHDHPSEGKIRQTRPANTFSGGMRQDPLPAPRLGEHTVEVLREFNVSQSDVDALIESGAACGPGTS